MGLGDILGSAAKIAKDAAGTGAKALADKAEQMKHQRKLVDYHRQICATLTPGQLKALLNTYAIEPKEPIDLSGNAEALFGNNPRRHKKKWVPNRDDYVNAYMRIPVEDVIKWSRRQHIGQIEALAHGRDVYLSKHGIDEHGTKMDTGGLGEPVHSLVSAYQPTAPQPTKAVPIPTSKVRVEPDVWEPSPLVNEIVAKIKSMQITMDFKQEKDAQIFLYASICNWYPNRVNRMEGRRREVDILIDDKIGIEVKKYMPGKDIKNEYNRLFGQMRYANNYEAYIIVIFGGAEYHQAELMKEAKGKRVIVIIKN